MSVNHEYYGVRLKTPSTDSFWLWELICARSEIKSGAYVFNDETRTILTPRLEKFKLSWLKAMEDCYIESFTPIRERYEQEMSKLEFGEQERETTFERNLAQAQGEPPLRSSLESLREYRNQLAERASDLSGRAETLKNYFRDSYKGFELRSGKYLEALSRCLKTNLTLPFGQEEFPRIAEMEKAAKDFSIKVAEYAEKNKRDRKRYLDRVSEMKRL